MKTKNYLLLILGGAVILLGLVAALISSQKPQEIRKKAAVPGGTATISLSPSGGTYPLNQPLPVEIRFNSSKVAISAITVRLTYPFSGNTPEVAASDLQINSQLTGAGWTCPIKDIYPDPEMKIIKIDISCLYLSTSGFTSSGETALASFNLTANQLPPANQITLSFDPQETKIISKEEGKDILSTPLPTASFTIANVTPTLPQGCQPVSLTISPSTPRPGEKITIDAYSSQPLVCVEITSAGGISGNLTNFRIEGEYHWKWDATAGSQPGNYSVTFRGNTTDSGVGQCPDRAIGSWCQATTNYVIAPLYTPTPTLTPIPTPTQVGPTPTSLPGQVKIKLNVKFAGVGSQRSNQLVKVKIGKGETILHQLENINLKANDQGVYESEMLTLPPVINAGSNYYFLIKGPKHLQVRFCQNSGQNRPCTRSNITLDSGENFLDFSGYPLPGGDLPPQDGVVNAIDAVALINCLETPDTPSCLAKADLNFDGIINTMDINIMNNTIYTRWEDE